VSQWFSEAIDSVLVQTYQDFEIIVVDSSSNNDVVKIVEKYGNRVKYYYQDPKGLPAALNLGIRMSNGKYIAFLDADDLWLPRKLELQIELFKRQPDLGLVYSALYVMGAKGKIFELRSTSLLDGKDNLEQLFVAGNLIQKPTVMVRRECFELLGLFDETMLACEDYEMWFRVTGHFKLGYINVPLAKLRKHARNLSRRKENWDYELLLTNKMLKLNPHLTPLKNKRLARIYYGYGIYYFNEKLFADTRNCFIKAIHYNFRNIKPYGFFLCSNFIGSKMIAIYRGFKGLLQGCSWRKM